MRISTGDENHHDGHDDYHDDDDDDDHNGDVDDDRFIRPHLAFSLAARQTILQRWFWGLEIFQGPRSFMTCESVKDVELSWEIRKKSNLGLADLEEGLKADQLLQNSPQHFL